VCGVVSCVLCRGFAAAVFFVCWVFGSYGVFVCTRAAACVCGLGLCWYVHGCVGVCVAVNGSSYVCGYGTVMCDVCRRFVLLRFGSVAVCNRGCCCVAILCVVKNNPPFYV